MLKYKVILFVLCFADLGYAQENAQKADSLLNMLLHDKGHGLSVLVAQDSEVLYQRNLGYANVGEQSLVNNETIFRIGSVTKQFTAVAILKLVEDGKLKLSDPLAKFIPDFPRGEEVNIKHLLTHTSGIKNFTDQTDFISKVSQHTTTDALIDEIKTLGYDFSPGENWKYSNSGYFILGYIIEKQSGMQYSSFLQKNIFTPASMMRTGVYNNQADYENEALGYSYENDTVDRAIEWDMTWAGAAGSLYSTTTDLHKWNQSIFSGKIIPESVLKRALTKVLLNDSTGRAYGFGWSQGEYKGLKLYAHSGGLHGFLSYLAYYPEVKGTVVVLSNCSPAKNIMPGKLAMELTNIFFNDVLEKNIEIKPDYSFYEQYVGQYEYPGGNVMTITKDANHLYAQLSGQSKYEIFPRGEHKFFWKIVDAEITFQVDPKGVKGAIHDQGGSQFTAPKLEEKEVITLKPDIFDRYAGNYSLPNAIVKVWEEDGKYYTQISGQPQFEIFPQSNDKFFMKAMAVEIEFEKGDPSPALVIHQGGREIRAERKP